MSLHNHPTKVEALNGLRSIMGRISPQSQFTHEVEKNIHRIILSIAFEGPLIGHDHLVTAKLLQSMRNEISERISELEIGTINDGAGV